MKPIADMAKQYWYASVWSRRLHFKPQEDAIISLHDVAKNSTGMLKQLASQRLKEIEHERRK